MDLHFDLKCTFLLFIIRSVYQRADKALRNAEEKEERVMLLEAWKEFEVEIYVCDNPRLLYPISLQSRIFLTNLAVVLNFCTYDLYLCRYLRLINFKDYHSISSCIAWWLAYGEKIPVPFFKPIRDRSKAFARFPLPVGIFSISFSCLICSAVCCDWPKSFSCFRFH